jgi:hypothetical protein
VTTPVETPAGGVPAPIASRFVRYAETARKTRVPLAIAEATPQTLALWDADVQPRIRASREFRFDRRWQWPALLKFHHVQETIVGLSGSRPPARIRLLQAFAPTADGDAYPVGQVLLACGFPFIRDWNAQSVFLWYLAAAPRDALHAAALPPDLKLMRVLVDIAVQESLANGFDGRVGLHAARSRWNLAANRDLYNRYRHIGLAPLPGGLRASVGRRNDRRYFYLDPPLALDFARRLDYLR